MTKIGAQTQGSDSKENITMGSGFRPSVAVVVDAYSSWPHIQRCLDSFSSVLDKSRDKLVVLLRTDPSSSASKDIVKRLKLYPWANVIDDVSEPVAGTVEGAALLAYKSRMVSKLPSYAVFLNRALESLQRSTYDILFLADSSMLIDVAAFRQILDALNDERVGAVGSLSNNATGDQLMAEVAYDPNDIASLRQFSRNWSDIHGGETQDVEWLDPGIVAFHRRALVGNFNTDIHEPVYVREDMIRRIADSGWKLRIARGAFLHYDTANLWMDAFRKEQIDHDRQTFFGIHGEQPRASVPMLISACLITKDEEKNLPECLESLAGIADEVVIYDTGSSDKTIEIARSYGATVVEGYWDDDFSRARNAARQVCQGQWILWVDADERVVAGSPETIRQSLAEMPSNIEGCLIHIDNLEGTGVTSAFTHPACRVFRRLRCHWHGRLHEQISLVDQSAKRAPFLVPFTRLRLLHVGYLDEAIRNRAKPERNVRVAAEEIGEAVGTSEDSRDESYLKISLARSKSMVGEAEEAVEMALGAVEIATDPTTRRLGLRTAIEALKVLGRLDEALEQVDELRRCSSNPITANTLEALIRLQMGEPEAALSLLENIGEREVDDDMFEYHASQFMGMRARALSALGRYSEASDLLLNTLSEEGVLDAHLGDLIDALERSGRSVDEVASALKKGKSLVPFMAQLVQLPPEKADAVLEACYVRWGSSGDRRVPSEVMATAAIVARHLNLARVLEWAIRIRDMGIVSQDDILLERARNLEISFSERALSVASCIYAFEDREAYTVLRSMLNEAISTGVPDVGGGGIFGNDGRGSCMGGMDNDSGSNETLESVLAKVDALVPGLISRVLLEVSMVVYCHNDADATGRCLTAVQKYCKTGSYEVILVDDASTDSTRELTVPVGSRLRLHRNAEHLGALQSYRLGSQLANAPYIILMDNHAVLFPGQVDRLVEALGAQDGDSGISGHDIITIDKNGDRCTVLDSLPSGATIGAFRRDAFPMVDWSTLGGSAHGNLTPNDQGAMPTQEYSYGSGSLDDVQTSDVQISNVPIHDVLIHDVSPGTREDAAGGVVNIRIRDPQGESIPAIHVIGPLGVASGLGKATRLVEEACTAAGLRTSCTSIDILERDLQVRFMAPSTRSTQETNGSHIDIICMNPDQLQHQATRGLPVGCNDAYRVAMWNWETEDPPKGTVDVLGRMNEIWVLSDFERRVFRKASSSIPIHIFPYPLSLKSDPLFSRASMGLPQGFIFLNIFDAFSNVSRKNPDGLITAFTRAFSPGECPMLVMKINNADKSSCLIRLRQLARGRDDIKFIVNEVYTDERIDSLVAAADSYVSLHCSEGFGLPLADAMAWGKPVIATGYSGNLDFMNEDNSYLVPWHYTELAYDDGPYPAGARWAEPDLDRAAEIMRNVFYHQDVARAKGEAARAYIRGNYSLTRAVEFVERRAASIAESISEGIHLSKFSRPVQCLVNSVTLSGKSGASSGKAEDEGVAGSYVEDENAARGVIWLAGTHGYLRDTALASEEGSHDNAIESQSTGSQSSVKVGDILSTGGDVADDDLPSVVGGAQPIPTMVVGDTGDDLPPVIRDIHVAQGIDIVPPLSNYRSDSIVFHSILKAIGALSIPFTLLSKGDNPTHDVVVVFSDPDALPAFAVEHGEAFFERYVIGCFDWPLDDVPANVARGFRYMNEIWVPSEQAYRAVSRTIEMLGMAKPVVKLPMSGIAVTYIDNFDGNADNAGSGRYINDDNGGIVHSGIGGDDGHGKGGDEADTGSKVAIDEGWSSAGDMHLAGSLQVAGVDKSGVYVLTVADVRSPLEMNNTLGVIEAFSRAFPDGADSCLHPFLVVGQSNGVFRPADRRAIEKAIAGRTDIVIASAIGAAGIAALVRRCAVYISLKRATGFDWPLILAVYDDIPTMAICGSGHEEWSDRPNLTQVPAAQGSTPAGCWPYPEGASWSEPDLEAASKLLVGLYNSRDSVAGAVVVRHGGRGTGLSGSREEPLPVDSSGYASLAAVIDGRVRFAHNAFVRAKQLARLRGTK